MTRSRNGAASAAPAGTRLAADGKRYAVDPTHPARMLPGVWHDLPQPGDDEPDEPRGTGYRPPPAIIDGDERTVRTTSGAICLAVYSDRTGWRVSEDDPTYGTDDEPSCYSDHAITVAAVLVEAPRPSRHGKYVSPRVLLTIDAALLASIDAECERDGMQRSEWMREACRAYLLLGRRDRLTDADWRKVVGG